MHRTNPSVGPEAWSSRSHSEKTALIVKVGRIGDVIMAIPAARALHERGFDIHWIGGRAVKSLLECYSWIRVVTADEQAILFGGPWQRAIALVHLWRGIAGHSYDLCATLYYDRRYRLLTLPIRARRRLSLSALSRSVSFVPGRYQSGEFLRVLLGEEDSCVVDSILPVAPDRLPRSPFSDKPRARRIAIVAGGAPNLVRQQAKAAESRQLVRRWPIENFRTLAEVLTQRDWEVVLIGGPDDGWVSQEFQQLSVTDCIGKLSLPQVISACDDCDAVICHDTGPMHLAGLSSTCLLAIFGPSDPAVLLPRRPYSVGIWGGQGFACRPCYDGRDFAPCQFNGCMHQVTPELVLRELDRLLSDREQGVPSPWRIVVPEPALGARLVSVTGVSPAQQ